MTHSTNFYYAILIATAVGATIFMVVVTLTQDQIFGSKLMVEVPTYAVNETITGPNGTTFIEIEHEDDTTLRDFPFVNGTATINIEEYEVCVSSADAQVLESSLNMGFNTLEPKTIELLKNISMGSMQNCIYLNSANNHS
jgi:hypothetical protein